MPPSLNRARFKRVAAVVGGALCVVAIGLLIRRGAALGDALGDRLAEIEPASFAAALAAYLAGALALGAAWIALVRCMADAHARARPLLIAHLRAQVAKYLPGNVFHFAYRHAAARAEGVGHVALGGALALESALLIAASAIVALGVVADPRLESVVPHARLGVWAAPLLAALAIAAALALTRRYGRARASLRETALTLVAVLAIDLVFFALAAVALRLLCAQPTAMPFSAWCGWLSLAWVVGYVTPGAPGGIGLRETVLVLGLQNVLGEADALAVALAYRLLTLIADGLLAALGFAIPNARA